MYILIVDILYIFYGWDTKITKKIKQIFFFLSKNK